LQLGFEVDIFEQASQLGEVGAGLQIAPNGTRVLNALGLDAALQTCVSPARGKEIRMWNTGQSWKLFDLGDDCLARFGAPYWMVHRGDLHRVLLSAFAQRSRRPVHLNARILLAQSHDSGVTFRLHDGSFHEADALLAADGVHSVLREQLLGEEKAHFTGLLAWSGLVPMDRIAAHLQNPVGTNWVGPGAHVVTYPVRAGELMNVVGIIERTGWHNESWTEPGTHAELLADFGNWHADVCELMRQIDAVEAAFPRSGYHITVNTTLIKGGSRSNIIPEYAEATLNVRGRTTDEMAQVGKVARDIAAHPRIDGATVEIEYAPSFPPLVQNDRVSAVAARASKYQAELGSALALGGNGGASESAMAEAAGTPTLDGLGSTGAGAHTPDETIDLSSVTPRLYVLTRLIAAYGKGVSDK